jgi:hypothetical protein
MGVATSQRVETSFGRQAVKPVMRFCRVALQELLLFEERKTGQQTIPIGPAFVGIREMRKVGRSLNLCLWSADRLSFYGRSI